MKRSIPSRNRWPNSKPQLASTFPFFPSVGFCSTPLLTRRAKRSLRKANETSEKELNELKAKLAAAREGQQSNPEVAQLEASLVTERTRIKELEERLTAAREQSQDTLVKLSAQTNQIEVLQSSRTAAIDELKASNDRLAKLELKNSKTRNALQRATKTLDQEQAEHKRTKRMLEESNQQLLVKQTTSTTSYASAYLDVSLIMSSEATGEASAELAKVTAEMKALDRALRTERKDRLEFATEMEEKVSRYALSHCDDVGALQPSLVTSLFLC